MTPCVRPRISGEARQVATASYVTMSSGGLLSPRPAQMGYQGSPSGLMYSVFHHVDSEGRWTITFQLNQVEG